SMRRACSSGRCPSMRAACCPRPIRRPTTRPIASTPTAWWRGSPCSPHRSSSSAPIPTPRCTARPARMRILFILDPLPELKAYKDSSVAMMQAAVARGHRLFACEPADIWMRDGIVSVRAHALELTPGASDWSRVGDETPEPLPAFDAVLMRQDPPFHAEELCVPHPLRRAH